MVVQIMWQQGQGGAFAKQKASGWGLDQNAKLSHWGSILGVLLEVVVEGDAGRLCGGADDAGMGVG